MPSRSYMVVRLAAAVEELGRYTTSGKVAWRCFDPIADV
jgi:hypothetical protein